MDEGGHGDAVSLREGWENKGVSGADGQKAVPTNDLVERGSAVDGQKGVFRRGKWEKLLTGGAMW